MVALAGHYHERQQGSCWRFRFVYHCISTQDISNLGMYNNKRARDGLYHA
jgi:hypothetical protein